LGDEEVDEREGEGIDDRLCGLAGGTGSEAGRIVTNPWQPPAPPKGTARLFANAASSQRG
jgi:hypothetical protein